MPVLARRKGCLTPVQCQCSCGQGVPTEGRGARDSVGPVHLSLSLRVRPRDHPVTVRPTPPLQNKTTDLELAGHARDCRREPTISVLGTACSVPRHCSLSPLPQPLTPTHQHSSVSAARVAVAGPRHTGASRLQKRLQRTQRGSTPPPHRLPQPLLLPRRRSVTTHEAGWPGQPAGT
jgi:hypothetical protein